MRSEEELMLAYARGEERAFEELFSRVGRLVLGYMRRGWRPEEDARDLTQQTFLQLHRARRDFRPGRPLRPWLMTIARNVLRDHLRRERGRNPSVGLDQLLESCAGRGSPAGEMDLRDALAAAIDRLPGSLRDVVTGHWREHLSYRQLARRLGTTHAAVKVRAHRAYRRLRRTLAEEGFDG